MLRRRFLWIIPVVASVGVFVMPSGPATAATVPNTPAPGNGPFDSQTVFCTKHTPPPGKRNSSSPGVTPNSVTIADNSIDAASLRRLGVDVADFHQMYQTFVDEVNRCGGVNGRKIILKSALYNPTAADLGAHYQAICLKTSEDIKAFMAIGIGPTPFTTRCIAVQHKTIVDAPAFPTDAEFRESKGRVVSQFPAGDKLAAAFIADGVAQHTFDGKKITVVGTAQGPATVIGQQRDQFVGGFKKVGIDVDLEILPCDGGVCTKGVGSAVRRIKSSGSNMIVLTTNYNATSGLGTFFREMASQNVNATVTGPSFGSQHTDSTVATVVAQAGTDGMAWVARNRWTATGELKVGEWRDGRIKESTFAHMCMQIFAKATKMPVPYQFNDKDITSTRWGSVATSCIGVRTVVRALYSLGNNVTTERMVAALKVMKPDRRDTGPNARDVAYYNGSDDRPPRAFTMQINYPCPLPLPRPAVPIGCAMPTDSPMRFRAVKY